MCNVCKAPQLGFFDKTNLRGIQHFSQKTEQFQKLNYSYSGFKKEVEQLIMENMKFQNEEDECEAEIAI